MLIKRLKEARLRAGLSQEKLGILAGIDEASASARMNQYERGKHAPDYEMANRLAKVLQVPVSYFYTQEDDLAQMILKWSELSESERKTFLLSDKDED
ncbi:helix-turn-helix transcriptional regulator [Enterobacter oligotrophicus]|uniref:helix-turn-helix domain-containing protein n=1 Tax=Enterobacter TaxID=547 RepID=UPI001C01F8E4|nr:helix-turn-helix transcriptional regulator [Enterobacter oligotrophicus]ELW1647087.1 helix-turn-helix transcriptional regulator [Enterobacter oligotrophicus]MBT9426886.1 helix-turn-helix transcriptional regulator [Enterobacter oligotrophicus]